MLNKKFLVLGGILLVALAAGLGLHFKNKMDFAATTQEETATNTEGISVEASNSNYTIELDNADTLEEIAPSLDRVVKFSPSIPNEVQILIQTKIDELAARLKKDPYRADDWLQLGVLYHSANDYLAARDVWEFLLRVLEPKQAAVVYDNLGKLYKFDLKDFPASESYFRSSMEADPSSITPYIELFELYRYLYKTETTAPVDILNEAAKKFSESIDPYTLLGSYYRDKKDYTKARDAFGKALNKARDRGDVHMISVIGKEIESLPQ